MKDKKLTDEEIVKALENQANGYGAGIVGDLSALTLDLIHRQKAEIERLAKAEMDLIGKIADKSAEIERLTRELDNTISMNEMYVEKVRQNAELQKQVDELKEKIMNLKSAMIDRVARKSYDSLLTMPEDVEEIFGDAYESEFNKFLGQAVKDTAKEILQEQKDKVALHMNEAGNWVNALDEDYINEIAKRKGVEVE